MFKRNAAGELIEVATGKVVTEADARARGWEGDGYVAARDGKRSILPMVRQARIRIRAEQPAAEGEKTPAADDSGYRASLTLATSNPVQMRDWDGPYLEILSMEPAHVRLGRLNNGAPLLDSHNGYQLASVLGVMEGARIEKGELVADVRFSKRDDVKAIVDDVRDGIIQNVSIGYRVYKYERTEGGSDKMPTLRAIDWEPYEGSLVPMGADDGAGVRTAAPQQHNECEIIPGKDAMNFIRNAKGELVDLSTGNAVSEEYAKTRGWKDDGYKPPMPTQQQPAPAHVDVDAARREGALLERKRVQDIDGALRAVGLDSDAAFRATLIGDGDKVPGASVDAARAAILDKKAKETEKNPIDPGQGVRVLDQSRENRARGIENALMHRARPETKLEELGRQYRGMTALRMAEECVSAMGVNVRGMVPAQIAQIALGARERAAGMHSTSDFPGILANVANISLRAGYQATPRTFQPWARRVTLTNFKLKTVQQFGEAPGLKQVDEGGEYEFGSIGEGKETYKLVKYGRKFAVTWETIINDDLDAIARLPYLFAQKSANKESDLVYAQITGNPVMGDGKALFHTDHKNIATGGAIDPPGLASVSSMRALMRKQTGVAEGADAENLGLVMKFMLLPAELELLGAQLVSNTVVPTGSGSVVPDYIKQLVPIVESRLDVKSLTEWYGVCDPGQNDTLEYAHLEGFDGPFIETREGFDVDGVEMKCRLVFAAKAIDWRSFQYNLGT